MPAMSPGPVFASCAATGVAAGATGAAGVVVALVVVATGVVVVVVVVAAGTGGAVTVTGAWQVEGAIVWEPVKFSVAVIV